MTLALPVATTQSDDAVASVSAEYRDLAPTITRQRLVVEGYPRRVVEFTEQYFRTTEIVAREF